jgi:Asp/Glu/hydantoin racemase
MNILLINPNTSTHITEKMVAVAQSTLKGQASVIGVTAKRGPAVVGSRVENTLAAVSSVELGAAYQSPVDAVVLGISTDSGLAALRELLNVPVVGMLEAALLTACQLGGRIGLLTLGRRMLPLYQEQIAVYGLSGRLFGWRAMELPAAFGHAPGPEVFEAVAAEAAEMVAEHGLDVIILSGAVLAGCRAVIQHRVSVPIIDGIEAASLQALALSLLQPIAHQSGSYALARGRKFTDVAADISHRMA